MENAIAFDEEGYSKLNQFTRLEMNKDCRTCQFPIAYNYNGASLPYIEFRAYIN